MSMLCRLFLGRIVIPSQCNREPCLAVPNFHDGSELQKRLGANFQPIETRTASANLEPVVTLAIPMHSA